ncbi:MAG: IclR family transcriptional regulator [Alphaproteobacteria bacterium]|jgi:DNA-binding IclR family transcriptional regulator|nr:IclR family transcriptional regulator [Alphaproteobacteria bacterium]
MERDRRGIQSIEVGGALLQALARDGAPMMLRDLARAADMPAAKAHPYLVSFGKIGLVEQDAATGRYGLGPLALQLGLASLRHLDPLRLATPAIAALSDSIGHAVAVAVWGNVGPTVVRLEESRHPIHANLRVGTVMALADTATGRLFAAYLPPERLDGPMGPPPPSETLVEIRRRGLARAQGQPIPGINAFSAPVFDQFGRIVLALTALGPSASFDAAWDSPIATAIAGCAATLSARLGHVSPVPASS